MFFVFYCNGYLLSSPQLSSPKASNSGSKGKWAWACRGLWWWCQLGQGRREHRPPGYGSLFIPILHFMATLMAAVIWLMFGGKGCWLFLLQPSFPLGSGIKEQRMWISLALPVVSCSRLLVLLWLCPHWLHVYGRLLKFSYIPWPPETAAIWSTNMK